MGLSIITPHFNDVKGIRQIYDYLLQQSSQEWQWIIVDDCSDSTVQIELNQLFKETMTDNIKVVFREFKTNASSCRNKGVEFASYKNLVFLDADDKITSSFVKNRLIDVEEFSVFLNITLFNDKGVVGPFSTVKSDFLTHFLKANFVWQTTSVLWDVSFFKKIGQFDDSLPLLEDVELALRALLIGKKFKVLHNSEIDFYYFAKPIDTNRRTVEKVSKSVALLIARIRSGYNLEDKQLKLLSSYYFLAIRYLVKSRNKKEIHFLKRNLNVMFKSKCVSFNRYIFGSIFLSAFSSNIISDHLFLRLNRYFFKK